MLWVVPVPIIRRAKRYTENTEKNWRTRRRKLIVAPVFKPLSVFSVFSVV
jgi:hypothetical protein